MGVITRIREFFAGPITEQAPVATVAVQPPTAAQVRRTGFEYGVVGAKGSSVASQIANGQERVSILHQLHQAYLACPWVSGPIDLIARTVTAGGLQLVQEVLPTSGDDIPQEPGEVTRLRRLLKFVNPREDIVQLLRSAVIDLELFGDAFIEVVWLLGEPIALYTLDATTMTVIADEHGEVSGYKQDVDGQRKASFTPDEVIHISLDSPRGGMYGVSPTTKALLPVTAWLFVEATIKECFRRGDPPRVHVDLGHMSDTDVQQWREQYQVSNLGPKAVGNPVTTTNGGKVAVLDPRKVMDYLAASKQLRDEIISTFGVPPAKLGIIESGNLGGGTAEGQDKTLRVNTIIPVANLVLEKLNFTLLGGFKIAGWRLEFGEIDMRDSKVVEEIREIRLKAGAYTLNRWRDEIGEPPVDGGDVAILAERSFAITWDDMQRFSDATVQGKGAPGVLAQVAVDAAKDPAPVVPQLAPAALLPQNPQDGPGLPGDAIQGQPPKESALLRDQRALSESWGHAYRVRRKQALKELPVLEKVG